MVYVLWWFTRTNCVHFRYLWSATLRNDNKFKVNDNALMSNIFWHVSWNCSIVDKLLADYTHLKYGGAAGGGRHAYCSEPMMSLMLFVVGVLIVIVLVLCTFYMHLLKLHLIHTSCWDMMATCTCKHGMEKSHDLEAIVLTLFNLTICIIRIKEIKKDFLYHSGQLS